MDTKSMLSAKQWQHYLTRPFSIFGASLWHEWYSGDITFEVFGTRCPDVLFIEEAKDVVRCYREKKQIAQLIAAAKNLFFHPEKCLPLLEKAHALNKKAQLILDKKETFSSFQEAADFYIQLSVYATVLPFRLNDCPGMVFDKRIVDEVEKLRKLSLYPRILEEVVIPLAKKECKDVEYITIKELSKREYSAAKQRIGKNGFTYAVIEGKEEISFGHASELIQQLEPLPDVKAVKGIGAYPGKAQGIVRITNQRTIQGVIFNEGDILISVSTSPIYLPLMKKAGAIVADEGGVISHAAILSRELKKPCVIGTKNATRVFKDGDIVEVDAVNGIVKKVA